MKKNIFLDPKKMGMLLLLFCPICFYAEIFNGILYSNSVYSLSSVDSVQQGIRFKSNFFDISGNFILKKETEIKTAATIITPLNYLSLAVGQVITAGFISLARRPELYTQALFHSTTTTIADFTYNLPTANTSKNTPYSFIADVDFERFRFFCGTSFLPNQKSFVNSKGLEIPLYIGLSTNLLGTKKKSKSSTEKTNANLLIAAGRFYNDSTFRDSSWFTQSPYFSASGYHYFMSEFDFSSPLLSFFTAIYVSESPFQKIVFFNRSEIAVHLNFFHLHTEFLFGDRNLLSGGGNLLRQPLEIYINPQFIFNFYGKIPFTVRIALGIQVEKEFSTGKNSQEKNSLDLKNGITINTKNFFVQSEWALINANHLNFISLSKETELRFFTEFAWKPKWNKLQQDFSLSVRYSDFLEKSASEKITTLTVKIIYRPLKLLKTEYRAGLTFGSLGSFWFSTQAKAYMSFQNKFTSTHLSASLGCEKTSKNAKIKMIGGLGAQIQWNIKK